MKLMAISLVAITTIVSCKKDDTTPPQETPTVTSKTQSNLVADPALTGNRYALFSLETNQAIASTDSATTKWDIGFRGTNIIINAGTSGPGLGGAFVQTSSSYDTYNTIPADSTFRVDAAPILAVRVGSNNGWYSYNAATNVIAPIPGRFIVVRTASGKYAKVDILSYYLNAPTAPTGTEAGRYYTFRYAYQANGSKSF